MRRNCRLQIADCRLQIIQSAIRKLQSAIALTLLLFLPAAVSAGEDEQPPTYQDLVFLGDKGPVFVRVYVEVDGKPADLAWKNFLQKWFKYLDRNGDGSLTKE